MGRLECSIRGREWGEAGLTYEVANNHTVQELQGADNSEEGHEGVKQFCALRRPFQVIVPDLMYDILRVQR